VLGRGQTLLNGFFDVRFENDGPPGYRVVVIAKQEGIVLPQLVKEQGSLGLGAIYAISSEMVDELMMPDAVDFELLARANEAGPAFNIFDVGLRAETFVRGIHGRSAPYLEWLWTPGEIGSCGPPIFRTAVTCCSYAFGEISVLSLSDDSDEYDDTVLLHEFGHHWQAHFSRNSSIGGKHSSNDFVDAQLAFSEGAATFFGQSVAGTDIYLDTRGAETSARSLENIAFRVPQGTSDFTIRGDLPEAVVDGILWDLADSTNEGRDTITNRAAVFAALGKLRPFFYGDRATFGADLVDLLDKWFCLGHGMRGDANSGVQGILALNNHFPYDFPAVVPCN